MRCALRPRGTAMQDDLRRPVTLEGFEAASPSAHEATLYVSGVGVLRRNGRLYLWHDASYSPKLTQMGSSHPDPKVTTPVPTRAMATQARHAHIGPGCVLSGCHR
jgi:hypothetical protein